MPSAPIGWLELDGSTFDTAKYAALYSLLNTNKLPDFRECVLVGAGQSSNEHDASTNPNGIHEHDVYTVGQFKDDQLQDHTHGARVTDRAGGDLGTMQAEKLPDVESSARYTPRVSKNVGFRTGTTTHGKQVGVLYCIKAL